METITLPKEITRGRELVVVSKKDFDDFKRWKNGVRATLEKVRRGRSEYKSGKTMIVSSPRSFR